LILTLPNSQINDKSEALAHQRLAARMLAKKNHELEEKVSTLSEEVFLPATNGTHDGRQSEPLSVASINH
jgi:hypothetical protein